jgi:hypothetical protein
MMKNIPPVKGGQVFTFFNMKEVESIPTFEEGHILIKGPLSEIYITNRGTLDRKYSNKNKKKASRSYLATIKTNFISLKKETLSMSIRNHSIEFKAKLLGRPIILLTLTVISLEKITQSWSEPLFDLT